MCGDHALDGAQQGWGFEVVVRIPFHLILCPELGIVADPLQVLDASRQCK